MRVGLFCDVAVVSRVATARVYLINRAWQKVDDIKVRKFPEEVLFVPLQWYYKRLFANVLMYARSARKPCLMWEKSDMH